jgi:hypothetical protein
LSNFDIRWRKAVELGLLNCLSYFILTCDIRSVSQGNIAWAIVVNIAIAMLGFSIFKRLQQSEGWADRIAFTLLGTVGTVIGILVTKRILGH